MIKLDMVVFCVSFDAGNCMRTLISRLAPLEITAQAAPAVFDTENFSTLKIDKLSSS